ncbi:MAG: hypothetical protein MHM6MM_009042 [Cercozoa sp. M6MM]
MGLFIGAIASGQSFLFIPAGMFCFIGLITLLTLVCIRRMTSVVYGKPLAVKKLHSELTTKLLTPLNLAAVETGLVFTLPVEHFGPEGTCNVNGQQVPMHASFMLACSSVQAQMQAQQQLAFNSAMQPGVQPLSQPGFMQPGVMQPGVMQPMMPAAQQHEGEVEGEGLPPDHAHDGTTGAPFV